MENKNKSAFPLYMPPCDGLREKVIDGLTKREYFAAMAMQGLLANPVYHNPDKRFKMVTVDALTDCAIGYADALLNQLDKQQ